jgi:hypothetical protein
MKDSTLPNLSKMLVLAEHLIGDKRRKGKLTDILIDNAIRKFNLKPLPIGINVNYFAGFERNFTVSIKYEKLNFLYFL